MNHMQSCLLHRLFTSSGMPLDDLIRSFPRDRENMCSACLSVSARSRVFPCAVVSVPSTAIHRELVRPEPGRTEKHLAVIEVKQRPVRGRSANGGRKSRQWRIDCRLLCSAADSTRWPFEIQCKTRPCSKAIGQGVRIQFLILEEDHRIWPTLTWATGTVHLVHTPQPAIEPSRG